MAYIQLVDIPDARGDLLAAYQAMAARPMPAVYQTPHGGAAGIVRAHSLDPRLIEVTFGTSGTTHAGQALTWAERELLASVASRINQCVY